VADILAEHDVNALFHTGCIIDGLEVNLCAMQEVSRVILVELSFQMRFTRAVPGRLGSTHARLSQWDKSSFGIQNEAGQSYHFPPYLTMLW
jgi:hypothetical protein